MRLLGVAALMLCAIWPAAAQDRAKRVALVIGIDRYDNVTTLKKAVNDANSVAATLEGIGFKVIKETDVTAAGFWRAWQRFEGMLQPGDEAAVFFSGHGVELGGVNYLVPRDAPTPDEGELVVEQAIIHFPKLIERLRARGPRLALFIIDACRDNPFPIAGGTRSIGATRGLARLEPPRGAFIMYSAGTGEKALDRLSDIDPHPNSVYTRTLLPLMQKPGLKLVDVAIQVRDAVYDLAKTAAEPNEQFPAYYDGVKGVYYLIPPREAAPQSPAETKPPVSDAAQAWAASDKDNPAQLEAIIRRYPDSVFADFARDRLAKLKPVPGGGGTAAEPLSGQEIAAAPTKPFVPLPPAGEYEDKERKLIRTLEGHLELVRSVAVSPDQKTIVSGGDDGVVKLWDAATGRLLRILEGHRSSVFAVAVSPTGKTIASASADNTMKLWEAATGRLIRTAPGHKNTVTALSFSPDGEMLVSAGADKTLRVWEATAGRLVRTIEGHADAVRAAAFSPDGAMILSASEDKTLKLWNAATGRLIKTMEGHRSAVWAATFSPDGETLISGSADNTLKLWETATGKRIRTFEGHEGWVYGAAFSPDGAVAVSASADKTLRLWETETGRLLRTIEAHDGGVYAAIFLRDGKTVVTAGCEIYDSAGNACAAGNVKLWDVSEWAGGNQAARR